MSTKTSIKRIALVAAAALAFGGLSAVPASATTTTTALPMYVSAADSGANPTAAAASMTATAVAGPFNYVTLTAGDDTAAGVLGVSIATTTGAKLAVVTQPSAGAETVTVATDGLSAVSTGGGDNTVLKISTPAAGTITATVSKIVDAAGVVTVTALQTITITVNAASVVGAVSTANTTSYISDSASATLNTVEEVIANSRLATAAAADDVILASKGTAGTPAVVAAIFVTLNDTQYPTVPMTSKNLTAVVTGSGLIAGNGLTADANIGATPARVATTTTDTVTGTAGLIVYSDGSSGIGTITITYTNAAGVSTVVGTETITFYSSTVATVSNTQILKIGAATTATDLGAGTDYISAATAPAFTVSLKDSNGNMVSGGCANILLEVADTKVFSSTVKTANEEDSTGLTGTGVCDIEITSAGASVSGSSTTVTPYVLAADGVTKIKGSPMTFSVGGTVAYAVAASFDKAEYSIGDLVTMTLALTDKVSKPVADGAYLLFDTTTSGAFSTSAQLTTAPYSNGTVTFINGVATTTFYAPYTQGTVAMSATLSATSAQLAAALNDTTFATSIAVSGADATSSLALDAANAATDAANNAYDEAQNATQAASDALAAVTALAAQVKSLIASVKKLTAAVAKLKK